jgi:hypothetical protein
VTDETRIAIELGIARHWPDFDAIQRDSGASMAEIHDVVDYLEDLEVNRKIQRFVDWCDRETMREAHTLHARLKRLGEDMPDWVRDGERAYKREGKRRLRRESLRAEAS